MSIVYNVNIYNPENIKGIEFFRPATSVYINGYYKKDTPRQPIAINVRNGALGPGAFKAEQTTTAEMDIKNNLLSRMFVERTIKQNNDKARLKHFRVIENGQVIFDTMVDTPKYWTMTEQELQAIIENISIGHILAVDEQDNREGLVFDGRWYTQGVVNEHNDVCTYEWNEYHTEQILVPIKKEDMKIPFSM